MNGRSSHSEMLKMPPLEIPNASMASAIPNRIMMPTPIGDARNWMCRSATPLASQISRARMISSSIGVTIAPEMPYTSAKLRNSGTLAVIASGLGSENRSMLVAAITSTMTGAGRTRQNSSGTSSTPTNTIATAWSVADRMPPNGASSRASPSRRAPATISWRRLVRPALDTARSRTPTTLLPQSEQEDERQGEAGHDEDGDVRGSTVGPVAEPEEDEHRDHDRDPLHRLTGSSGA